MPLPWMLSLEAEDLEDVVGSIVGSEEGKQDNVGE